MQSTRLLMRLTPPAILLAVAALLMPNVANSRPAGRFSKVAGFATAEATQGVAVGEKYFYAIGSTLSASTTRKPESRSTAGLRRTADRSSTWTAAW